jgi:purine-nucleoside phosphorylase
MLDTKRQVGEATQFIVRQSACSPRVAIVLGSGLGQFANEIDAATRIDYAQIPHFRKSTVVGHQGELIVGRIGGTNVCAMNGRFHTYEGYSSRDITIPIRVMHSLGASMLVISNASGGLNPRYSAGDVMLIEDQINLMHCNPLSGLATAEPVAGGRLTRVQGSRPVRRPIYDAELMERATAVARQKRIPLQRGVYCSVTGPNYETRAEIRMLRSIGADVVGMSTIPEVIVASQLGMRVLGLSAVTNKCSPDARVETSGDAVVVAAESTQPRMRDIVLGVLGDM